MKKAIVLSLAIMSQSALADCYYDGVLLKVGESTSVRSEQLMKESISFFRKGGFSEKEAKEKAEGSIWTTVVLQCVRTFTTNYFPDSEDPFGMLQPSRAALVVTSHQIGWEPEKEI